MRGIVIAVGDELISGKTVDTNSAFLAEELSLFGVETFEHHTVGDDQSALAELLRDASRKADVIVVSGGLGPTRDDLTRQALADALNVELELDEDSLEQIKQRFARRGRTMVPENRVQAMIPKTAQPLANVSGTAPGIYAELENCKVFVLPGVPHEMRSMFKKQVVPRLPEPSQALVSRIVHTFGKGESDLGAEIDDLMNVRDGDVIVGTTVAAGLVSVRIRARGKNPQQANRRAAEAVDCVKQKLGNLVVGVDACDMPVAAGNLLRENNATLATAESCTGGMIGQMLTRVAGSSDYYLGGIVAYANEVKASLLDVSRSVIQRDGAVSESVAMAMASGCRERFDSDYAVSCTGIAGPEGGTEEKPVGLVYIGIATSEGTRAYRHIFPGDREHVRMRTSLMAMNYVRLALVNAKKESQI